MLADFSDIQSQALALPIDERAELAQAFWESIGTPGEEENGGVVWLG